MLLDDSLAYPMDSFRFLRFSGKLDIDLFELSILSVIRFHPLLSSVIRYDSRLGYVWENFDNPVFIRRVNLPDLSCIPTPERIDIFNEAGFKVYIFDGGEVGSSALFQFHHTVSDGLGEMNLLADILTDYDARINGKTPQENPRNVDLSLLKFRGSSGLTLGKYFRYFIDTAFTTNQLLFRNPSPLLPCAKCKLDEPDVEYYRSISRELLLQETVDYFSFAKLRKVTVNDLLIRDLFLSMNNCRKLWGNSDGGWLRVSMPMSLRTELHERMPASNNVTMVFLDRRGRSCSDTTTLLRGINRETNWIKQAEQKHVLLLSLNICNLLPGGIGRMLRMRECRATAVLSNLGRVFELLPVLRRSDGRLIIGKTVLEDVEASPPIRYGTLISASVLTYAGRLRLILRYDAKNMTQNQADQLLQSYINNIISVR
jgi:hypothetical protein